MENLNPQSFEKKMQLAHAAADVYTAHHGFYMKDVAEQCDMEPTEIFEYFPHKKAIIQFFYASLIIRYEAMIDEIDDFGDYTLSEKCSNFIYTTFDMLSEKRSFVHATFQDMITDAHDTDFGQETERLIKQFLTNDEQLSLSSTVVLSEWTYSSLRLQYQKLILFWLNDTSPNQEVSMELTDKLTGVLQALMYSNVADRGVDLAKFMVSNKESFLDQMPNIKEVISNISFR